MFASLVDTMCVRFSGSLLGFNFGELYSNEPEHETKLNTGLKQVLCGHLVKYQIIGGSHIKVSHLVIGCTH